MKTIVYGYGKKLRGLLCAPLHRAIEKKIQAVGLHYELSKEYDIFLYRIEIIIFVPVYTYFNMFSSCSSVKHSRTF
jgi:hypothetical protein